MEEAPLSPGVQLAWRMAGAFAVETGSKEIEPVHLLFGLFNLEKLTETELRAPGNPKDEELHQEVRRISRILREAEVNSNEIRGKARNVARRIGVPSPDKITTSQRISRSAASRRAFERAARFSGSGTLEVSALLAAICNSGDAAVIECLGDKTDTVARFCGGARKSEPPPVDISLPDLGALQDPRVAQEPHRDVTILARLDAGKRLPDAQVADDVGKRFAALSDLAWEFGTQGSVDTMLQRALDELLRVVPAADHGAILVRESGTDRLALKAHSSGATPRLSMSSVRQAIDQKIGFLWTKGEDLSLSQSAAKLEAGIYVPMLADGEVFGVICLGTSKFKLEFGKSDLQLVNALAHQLALAIAHQELRRELRTNAKVMERLMTNFSPKIRTRLLQRARLGRLQLGGERAVVSVVCSDIRGFTRISEQLDAEDVADLLNDYFSSMTTRVFQNDGTINDFVGDAIMAVFGSPEEDPAHSLKALTAAVQMQEAARAVSAARAAAGKVSCEIGIGVHCGEVVHGFIGSNDCMEYTVVGEVVNYTARYCSGARGGEVLLSPEMHARVWDHVDAEKTVIETKHEGNLPAYRVLRLR
jgi:adenylate cyclase